jgi:LacI family gluconate utilization system Gnt-I transcriptional repressor
MTSDLEPAPESDRQDAFSEGAPTLAEVAERAGVSMITASRVVRLPHLVAPQTQARVQAAMRELGYIPNLVAGSLVSAKTSSVGVLVPTIANSIFSDTVQGLSDRLEPLGYAVILAQSRYDAAREDRMLRELLARRTDAIMMVGSPATAEGALLLRRARIPVVEMWDLPVDPIDAVAGFDNHAAGVTVARHMAEQGRTSLAFIGGTDPRAARRWAGFLEGALAANLAPPKKLTLDRTAANAAADVLDQLPDVDGVFAANDAHAIGFLAALRRAGLLRNGPASSQPVAVVGLGDLDMGQLIEPRLSTIRIHGAAIGKAAAGLMLDRSGPRRIDLGFELVLRESG